MNVVVRADASLKIGAGHVMRCLTLAQALKRHGASVSFICREQPGHLIDLIEVQGFGVKRLSPSMRRYAGADSGNDETQWLGALWSDDVDQTEMILADMANDVDWLVVDNYGIDHRWENRLRRHVKRIMVIDDMANRSHVCDLLLDQNLCEGFRTRYADLTSSDCHKLLGPRYALLREEFREARKRLQTRDGSVGRVLVFFGGTDPTGETEKTLHTLRRLDKADIAYDVVVGVTNPRRNAIREMCADLKRVIYHCQISNMASLMATADIAIGAGGSATWERCCLYLPTLIIVVAENQLAIANGIDKEGAAINLGWFSNVTAEDLMQCISRMLTNTVGLREMSRRAGEIADGDGAERVINAMYGLA